VITTFLRGRSDRRMLPIKEILPCLKSVVVDFKRFGYRLHYGRKWITDNKEMWGWRAYKQGWPVLREMAVAQNICLEVRLRQFTASELADDGSSSDEEFSETV
jgi:hypothetical protein